MGNKSSKFENVNISIISPVKLNFKQIAEEYLFDHIYRYFEPSENSSINNIDDQLFKFYVNNKKNENNIIEEIIEIDIHYTRLKQVNTRNGKRLECKGESNNSSITLHLDVESLIIKELIYISNK